MTPISTSTSPAFSASDTVFQISDLLQNILQFLPFRDAETMCCLSRNLEEKVRDLVICNRRKEVNVFIERIYKQFLFFVVHAQQVSKGLISNSSTSLAQCKTLRFSDGEKKLINRLREAWIDGDFDNLADFRKKILFSRNKMIRFSSEVKEKLLLVVNEQRESVLTCAVKSQTPEFFELTQSLLAEKFHTRPPITYYASGPSREERQRPGLQTFYFSVLGEILDGQWLSAMDRLNSLIEYEGYPSQDLDDFMREVAWAFIHAGECKQVSQAANSIENHALKNKFLSALLQQLDQSNLQNVEDLVNEIHDFYSSEDREFLDHIDALLTEQKFDEALFFIGPFKQRLRPIRTSPDISYLSNDLWKSGRRSKEVYAFCRIALALAQDQGIEAIPEKIEDFAEECISVWIEEGVFDKALEFAIDVQTRGFQRNLSRPKGPYFEFLAFSVSSQSLKCFCTCATIAGQDELVEEVIQSQDLMLLPSYLLGLAKVKKFEKAFEALATSDFINEMDQRLDNTPFNAAGLLELFIVECIVAGKSAEDFDRMDELLASSKNSKNIISAFVRAKKFDEALARIEDWTDSNKVEALQEIARGYAEEDLFDKAVELLEAALHIPYKAHRYTYFIRRQLKTYEYILAKRGFVKRSSFPLFQSEFDFFTYLDHPRFSSNYAVRTPSKSIKSSFT